MEKDGSTTHSVFTPQELERTLEQQGQQITEPIMQYFTYEHLPPHLQFVSAPFAKLAQTIVLELPRNPERTVALRKLLEAKDAAVRARLAK